MKNFAVPVVCESECRCKKMGPVGSLHTMARKQHSTAQIKEAFEHFFIAFSTVNCLSQIRQAWGEAADSIVASELARIRRENVGFIWFRNRLGHDAKTEATIYQLVKAMALE